MSILRQSNLFAAEDFRKVYKVYNNLDFTAYDYNSIKAALINNIKTQYPEDFNDYVKNSEFIAIIDHLAYLGTTLAFRVDLDTRQNLLPLAERRDAIINLTRLISYKSKRNIAASGLFKLSSIRTSQGLQDAEGNDLTNVPVTWDDPNNENWYDQFIQIFNAVAKPVNPFGRPSKLGTIGGVNTNLYQLNNVLGLDVAYNLALTINNETVPVDVVNPDFTDGLNIFERHPDQNNPFNLIYRTDGLGYSSPNTGFFLFFKQGRLSATDIEFSEPEPNRVLDINQTNINEYDVYVQEVDQDGNVVEKWNNVPSLSGNNIIYNSLDSSLRNIFEVITRNNDEISIKFADGTFGNIPTGIFRTWHRRSAGKTIVIRPEDATGLSISIPYTGKDNQVYVLSLTFDLEDTVANGEATETDSDIKERAPQAFYTQNRMVNNEDYNVYPLMFGNEVAKIKATNRTMAGHSRYLDPIDPTGFHSDLLVFGQDGALYKEYRNDSDSFIIYPDTQGNINDYVFALGQSFILENKYIDNHFYNEYLGELIKVPGNEDLLNFPEEAFWKTAPAANKAATGFFVDEFDAPIALNTTIYNYMNVGSIVKFTNGQSDISVSVKTITNGGLPIDASDTSLPGPVSLSQEVSNAWQAIQLIPQFRKVFNESETSTIKNKVSLYETFGMGYNIDLDEWYVILNPNENSNFVLSTNSNSTNTNSWQIIFKYVSATGTGYPSYQVICRGLAFVFESYNSTKFFWEENQNKFDPVTGKSLEDEITILSKINTDSEGNVLAEDVKWNITGKFIETDGYRNTAKVEISPVDVDEDGIYDNPLSFIELVNGTSIIFKTTTDDDGYTYTSVLKTTMFDLYSYDEVNDIYDTTLVVEYTPITVETYQLTLNSVPVTANEIYNIYTQSDAIIQQLTTILSTAGSNLNSWVNDINSQLENVVFRQMDREYDSEDRYIKFFVQFVGNSFEVISTNSTGVYHERIGKSFGQNTNQPETFYYFKWQHYSPDNYRIDPAPTNIVDIILLTNAYYRSIIEWKDSNSSISLFPAYPTNEQLAIQFNSLNSVKMISDELIYKSGRFKLLFGEGAESELKARFKIIKLEGATISDNEIKTSVVSLIDEYFSISNWEFGEVFYFTELASYIHSKLSKSIGSVVIVPESSDSQFGDLFEVVCESDELFLSSATVDNIEIVSTYTESNLRM